MDGGTWWAVVHSVSKSRARLSDFTFSFHFHALEKEMATHSSVLAWRIPGTGEPGRLSSMGSHRVGYDWSDLAAAAAAGLFIRLIKVESFEIWEHLCFKSSPGALMRNQIWETLICDMTNLDSILKSRDITLLTKVCLVKSMVFPVVMYGCESWTVKKAEHQRIDAFELWC